MPSRFWKASGNALLPSCNVLAVSGAAWTPALLPGLDLWVEAADTAHIFTDLGSIPVTTDGQAVEQWNDKSANARNLTQTVSGERALYKTDLPKPSLLFDGVDDRISSASSLTVVDGSGQHWFAISCRPAQTTSAKEIAVFLSSGGGYMGDIYLDASAHTEIQNAGGTFIEDTETGLVAGTDVVVIGTITTTALEAFVDNASNGTTAVTGTLKTTTGALVLGGNNSNFSGRIYGFVHGQGTLSPTDRANLQTYMAALHP